MTTHKRIENALSDLVGGNIWPDVCPKENTLKEWIVYAVTEFPGDHGDDVDQAWNDIVLIHYVHKGRVNYLTIKEQMKNRLRAAGFSFSSVEPFYDDSLASTHILIQGSMMEEGGQ